MTLEEQYQHLIQKRINLECKIAQQGLHRDAVDQSHLRKLNAKIKKLEDKMFSADDSMRQTSELPSEHAAYATKIFN